MPNHIKCFEIYVLSIVIYNVRVLILAMTENMKAGGLFMASGMFIWQNLTTSIVLLMGLKEMMASGILWSSRKEQITAMNN